MINPVEHILSKLENVSKSGKDWTASCPAHDDQRPSLSISEASDGRVLVWCHAGCSTPDIMESLGLSMADLMPVDESRAIDAQLSKQSRRNGRSNSSKSYPTVEAAIAVYEKSLGPHTAKWDYRDAGGELVGVVLRWDLPKGGKEIRPVSRNGAGWVLAAIPEPRPLLNLSEFRSAIRVYIVEGEPCVDSALSLGFSATTSIGGSKAAPKSDWTPLAGKECVILPDHDEPGGKYADAVAAILAKLTPAPVVKIVELPDLPEDGDIVDWIEDHDGKTEEQLVEWIEHLVSEAEPIEPKNIRAAPKERGLARIEFRPIPASQLGGGESIEWIWEGWVAKGYVTLLVGLWKAGKTTLVAHLLKLLENGGGIAGQIWPAKAVVIAEEGSRAWARRRNDIGIGDHVHFDIRPFMGKPTKADWQEYVKQIACSVPQHGYGLVVFDTWQTLNPCHDENNSAEMMTALLPLHLITEAGAAVLVVHHPKKGDANEGQASRGSGALPGFVDTIVELRRFNAEQAGDRRRKLKGLGRFDETPSEVVVELGEDGYRTVGTTGEAKRSDRLQFIEEILTDGESKTPEQVREVWPENGVPRPGLRTVRSDLEAGLVDERWIKEGKGVKGDPCRYGFDSCKVQPLDTGNESNQEPNK